MQGSIAKSVDTRVSKCRLPFRSTQGRRVESSRRGYLTGVLHRAVPAAEVFQGGEFGFAVEEIVFEDPVEIVIDEERPVGQEKWRGRQHVVDRLQ